MNRTFRTRDPNLAALLRYELGHEAHIDTVIDDCGMALFEFNRRERCVVILKLFYGRDCYDDTIPGGYLVNDARALLQESAKVHKALSKARSAWRKAQEEIEQ